MIFHLGYEVHIKTTSNNQMIKQLCPLLFLLLSHYGTAQQKPVVARQLTPQLATQLARLPLKCTDHPFPYKTGIVFGDTSMIVRPQLYHPAFYGCFDWHSAVHGHWMLVRLLRLFPELPQKDSIRKLLNNHLTPENIAKELELFNTKDNKSFERTYGWAWLLQLQNDLLNWNDADARKWAAAVQPLADRFSKNTIEFLNKLVYPIRVGEHTNLAFGLRLGYDYALALNDTALKNSIARAALNFYGSDRYCPLNWEPSGYDFLSPCLEEAALMSRILPQKAYSNWLLKFLPQLFISTFRLEPGRVKDRTDGKLVHLDGLNLSRAWCFKEIDAALGKYSIGRFKDLYEQHLEAGLKSVASGDYAGEHWLASFAVYALSR
jgi:hypothetical protein